MNPRRIFVLPGLPQHLGVPMVKIPAGDFLMGSAPEETDRWTNETLHPVTLSMSFFLGASQVTQALWQAVMGDNPSHHKGEQLPVEKVSWLDVQAFIDRLNHLDDNGAFRLPSEAEWEYACRAGSKGPYAGDLNKMAWYKRTSDGRTHATATKEPNDWGLYDMQGNVWEWCGDYYGSDTAGKATDPCGPHVGAARVVRGSSWYDGLENCRSAARGGLVPAGRSRRLGFRLARSVM